MRVNRACKHAAPLAWITLVFLKMGCSDPSPARPLPLLAIATHSAAHEAERSEYERLEERACAGVAQPARAACPLFHPVALKAIPTGIRVHVDPDQASEIVGRMRCHLAFARARGFQRVVECPLYLPGVEIALAEDRDAVEVTSTNVEIAGELVRRAFEVYGR